MDLSLKSRRKLWLKLHLYLGLFAGAVFVLIGLTGSLLAFEHSLDAWLNPKLLTVPEKHTHRQALPLSRIVSAGIQALPADGKANVLEFPESQHQTYKLWFEQPSPESSNLENHQVFINPYTAEVYGQRLKVDFERGWRGPLMDVVLRLHYSLALGSAGMTGMGFIGLALFFSLLSGLILWWPLSGKFSKALRIKPKGSFERLNFDLHKTFGFYSALVLLYLTFSGVYLIFPDEGRGLLNVFSPVAEPYPVYQSSPPQNGQTALDIDQITRLSDTRFPDGDYRWIILPLSEQGVYQVGKRAPDEVNHTQAYRTLWIDQYSGKILHERSRASQTAGDIFVEWLYPLHTGEAFGFAGQVLILLSGLLPLLLFVTGFIRWRQKRKAAACAFSRAHA